MLVFVLSSLVRSCFVDEKNITMRRFLVDADNSKCMKIRHFVVYIVKILETYSVPH
jgi:hypothetical protein